MKRYVSVAVLALIAVMVLLPGVAGAATPVATWEAYTTGPDANYTMAAGNWCAQSFTVEYESHTAFAVWLWAFRVGTPGTIVVSITETDSNGEPFGEDLALGSFDGDLITEDAGGQVFAVAMSPEVRLEYGEMYAIVISAEEGSVNNTLRVIYDSSAAGYTGGTKVLSSDGGLTWSRDLTEDFMFTITGRALLGISNCKVFSDYVETDDMLFVVEYENYYVPYYPLEDPSERFLLQLWSTDGETLIAQTTIMSWGRRPASIYLSAAQAAAVSLGGGYVLNLTSTLTEAPSYNYTLESADWRGGDLTLLDAWVINLARVLTDEYDVDMTTMTGSEEVLNDQGAVVFITGIPSLPYRRPGLFESGVLIPGGGANFTTDYYGTTTWHAQVGSTTADAVNDTADLIGVSDRRSMAGFIALGVFLVGLGVLWATGAGMGLGAALGVILLFVGGELRIFTGEMIVGLIVLVVVLAVFSWRQS